MSKNIFSDCCVIDCVCESFLVNNCYFYFFEAKSNVAISIALTESCRMYALQWT